jgi:hypothetical protein
MFGLFGVRRVSLFFYALSFVLALNLHCSFAFPIPHTLYPCIATSCPKQELPSLDSPVDLSLSSPSRPSAAVTSKFSLTLHNSTCAKGYADCTTDTGFVDCCDESKVFILVTTASVLLLSRFVHKVVCTGLEMLQL